MEDHHQEQFKTPQEFAQELDELEKHNNAPHGTDVYSRMSLFQAFDPLVALGSKTPQGQPITVKDEPAETGSLYPEAALNESSTLIYLNTPTPKQQHYVENNTVNYVPEFTVNANGHYKAEEMLDTSLNNKQEPDCGQMELVVEMTQINEQIADLFGEQLQITHQQFINSQKEEDRLNAEKSDLIEELDRMEKYYFRFVGLRKIVGDMDLALKDKDTILKEKDAILKEKELECKKWKQMADAQNAKETVSLKAQIKVYEMKLASLNSQINQKNKENEELSHIVEELIGKRN